MMINLFRLPLIQTLVLLALVAPAAPSGTTQLRSGFGFYTEFNAQFNVFGLAAAPEPDGNIWFTEVISNKYGWLTPSSTNANKDVKTFDLPAGSVPVDITVGENGQMWLTEYGRNTILRITAAAASSPQPFTIPTPDSAPFGIALGPDHNIWFTEYAGNKIGRITPTGDKIDEFSIPTPNSAPQYITQAAGNLWFTEADGNKIGRITPDGVISEFPIPTPNSRPSGITMGKDSVWFTESGANKIGRITLDGQFTAELDIPTQNSVPKGIVADNDGNLWFTEAKTSQIGLITPTGPIKEYEIIPGYIIDYDYRQSVPQAITKGSDGHIWFTEYGTDVIGQFDPAASFDPAAPWPIERISINGRPYIQHIAKGPDNNLWFTDSGRNAIGRTTPSGQIAEFSIPSTSTPTVIASGPGNTIWFAEYDTTAQPTVYKIARLTISDGQITEYPDATQQSITLVEIHNMIAGPDNTIWFTEYDASAQPTVYKVARLTISDGQITEYPVGGAQDIVVGPDNNIWFTEYTANKIGRLTISNGHIDEFTTPGSGPQDITTGSDGNLWFTEGNRIGRISRTGQDIAEFPETTSTIQLNGISGITAGRDGNLYFLECRCVGADADYMYKIVRITPDGQVMTEFSIPYSSEITTGPDGAIWFTGGGSYIGRLSPWGIALPLVQR